MSKIERLRRKFGMYKDTEGNEKKLDVSDSAGIEDLLDGFEEFRRSQVNRLVAVPYIDAVECISKIKYELKDIQGFIDHVKLDNEIGTYLSAAINDIAGKNDVIEINMRDHSVDNVGLNLDGPHLIVKGKLGRFEKPEIGRGMESGRIDFYDRSAFNKDGTLWKRPILHIERSKLHLKTGSRGGKVNIYGRKINVETDFTNVTYNDVPKRSSYQQKDRKANISKWGRRIFYGAGVLSAGLVCYTALDQMDKEQEQLESEIEACEAFSVSQHVNIVEGSTKGRSCIVHSRNEQINEDRKPLRFVWLRCEETAMVRWGLNLEIEQCTQLEPIKPEADYEF